jgi:hypothetical protein
MMVVVETLVGQIIRKFDRAVSQAANNPPSAPSGGDGGYLIEYKEYLLVLNQDIHQQVLNLLE